MKLGIVVPFSWSYLGGVGDHAEGQAEALEALGVETQMIMGDDPPGSVARFFHPDAPRGDERPGRVVPVGTTVTVPANGSRAHVVLSPLAIRRLRVRAQVPFAVRSRSAASAACSSASASMWSTFMSR